jgi:2-aminoadipate transaminase
VSAIGNFYVGSFSKIIAPSLRVGWIVAPLGVMDTLSVLKESSDLNVATFSQAVLANLILTEDLAAHIERLRTEYRSRRDAMSEALNAHFGAALEWVRPPAGFFFWVQNALGDTDGLLDYAIEEGVGFMPGSAFAISGGIASNRFMRLSFAGLPPRQIDWGIARLASAARKAAAIGSLAGDY